MGRANAGDDAVGAGVGVGVAAGVSVGAGVAVGAAVGAGVGAGAGVWVGAGVCVGAGVGTAGGLGVGGSVGSGVGVISGVGVGGGGEPVFIVHDVVGGKGAPQVSPKGVQKPVWEKYMVTPFAGPPRLPTPVWARAAQIWSYFCQVGLLASTAEKSRKPFVSFVPGQS